MASSDTLTFDQDPPHRPGLSELGGGAKENSLRQPPNPVTMPTAEDFNQFSRQHEAAGRVLPLARLWVGFSGGTPAILLVQALGGNVVAASFTVTDEGAGVTLISWKTGLGAPDGALPHAIGVKVGQTDDVEIDRIRAILTSDSGDPAARIKTKLGASGTDCNFWLEIC
jgi:hypothetical protein